MFMAAFPHVCKLLKVLETQHFKTCEITVLAFLQEDLAGSLCTMSDTETQKYAARESFRL